MDREIREMIAARMLPETGPIPKEKIDKVRTAVLAYIKQHEISRKQLAHEVGPSPSVISEFLAGHYGGRCEEIARDLNGWLEIDARRRRDQVQRGFVWTAVAKEMMSYARKCMSLRSIGLVYGYTGMGKTITAQAIAAEFRSSVYVLVGDDDTGVRGIRDAIFEAVTSNKRAKRNREQLSIAEFLTGSGRLILIDQAHKLTKQAMGYVFDLHDRTRCPMLLVGTVALQQRLAPNADGAFNQLSSRVMFRCNLAKGAMKRNGGDRLFTSDDVRAIFAKVKVRLSPGGLKRLTDCASDFTRGCLRYVDFLLVNAIHVARKRQGLGRDDIVTLTEEDVERTLPILNNDDRSTTYSPRTVETQEPIAATA
jgi:DNA transposition AAA+ family ATPase